MSCLQVDDLTVRFGGLTAVNEVDFKVEPGRIVSVIGPNGAGKTTVFNAITGIYEPTAGSILFQGRDLRLPLTPRSVIGFLVIGLLTALGVVFTINIEPLWEAVVKANFVYQQPFPYGKAMSDLWTFLMGLPSDLGLLLQVLAVEPHHALGRLVDAGDGVEYRGLSCTVGTNDRKDLAGIDGEIDLVDRRQPAEAHRQVGNVKDAHARPPAAVVAATAAGSS